MLGRKASDKHKSNDHGEDDKKVEKKTSKKTKTSPDPTSSPRLGSSKTTRGNITPTDESLERKPSVSNGSSLTHSKSSSSRLHLDLDKIDADRATKIAVKRLREFRDQVSPYLKDGEDGEDKMAALQTVYHELRDAVDVDERNREDFAVEVSVLKAQDEIRNQLEIMNRDYNEKFREYESKVNSLRDRLKTLHDKVEEAQGQTLIDNIRKMVVYQQLHNEIREKMNKINDAISNMGCFARFFCCHSKDITKMQNELDQLEHQRTLLSSDDVKTVGKIVAETIESERAQVEKELAEIIKTQPRKSNDDLLKKLAESEASIEAHRKAHYHTISETVMYLFVKLYALIGRIKRFLSKKEDKNLATDAQQTHAGSELTSTYRDVLAKQVSPMFTLQQDQNNHDRAVKFSQYYDRFHELSETEQRDIVYEKPSEELKQKVLTIKQDRPASPPSSPRR